MWISRAAYDALLRENGRLGSSCDWLAEYVNTLQQERSILLERVLEVQIPVMSIARDTREVPARDSPLTPEGLRQMAAKYAPPMAKGEVYQPKKSAAEGEAEAAMALFEDVGDETADKLGIAWTDNGEIAQTR